MLKWFFRIYIERDIESINRIDIRDEYESINMSIIISLKRFCKHFNDRNRNLEHVKNEKAKKYFSRFYDPLDIIKFVLPAKNHQI